MNAIRELLSLRMGTIRGAYLHFNPKSQLWGRPACNHTVMKLFMPLVIKSVGTECQGCQRWIKRHIGICSDKYKGLKSKAGLKSEGVFKKMGSFLQKRKNSLSKAENSLFVDCSFNFTYKKSQTT
jgi:hypothetical protein